MQVNLGELPVRIRAFRKARKESQEEFGRRFEVTRLTVINWEKGTRPNRDHHERLVRLLGEVDEEKRTDGGFQLRLPFDAPVDLALRISPQQENSIHFDIQVIRKVG